MVISRKVTAARRIRATSVPLRAAEQFPVPQIKESHALALDPWELGPTATVVAVPYQAMREDDKVTLTFAPLSGSLPWSQSKTLANSDLARPLKWGLPRSEVLKIDGESAAIRYRIEHAGGGESLSDAQTIEIVPPATPLLPPPSIEGHPGGAIDPGFFPEGLTIGIAPYPGIAAGDQVLLYWTGAQEAKSTIKSLAVDPSVIDSGVIAFHIEPAWLTDNIGGSVSILYQYARAGAAETSEPLTLSVLVPLDLPPPIVERAVAEGGAGENNGLLQASDATNGVFIKVPATVIIGDGDQVEMHWNGYPEGGRHVATEPVSPDDRHRFFIPATAVAANMGGESKRFDVFYRMTPAGKAAQNSDRFHLRIAPLPQTRYPAVQCQQAQGKPGLSLVDVPAEGADLRVTGWPFIAAGQLFTIWVTGVTAAGSATGITVRADTPVTQVEVEAERIGGKLPLAFLQTLKVNNVFTMWAKVSFDGGATHMNFPYATLTWLG